MTMYTSSSSPSKNELDVNIASYSLKYTKNKVTLYQYVFDVHRFCQWMGKSPDDVIRKVIFKDKTINSYSKAVDSFIWDLQAKELSPTTINNLIKGVKDLFKVNGFTLTLPCQLPKHVKFNDRAPTPEELSSVMEIANPKEKTVISILTLSTIRIRTRAKMTYNHVQKDL
jgi:hypothetical protein